MMVLKGSSKVSSDMWSGGALAACLLPYDFIWTPHSDIPNGCPNHKEFDHFYVSARTLSARSGSGSFESQMAAQTIEEFDDLPGGYLKMIRGITKNNVKEKITELKKIITPDYLNKSFIRAEKIDSDPEKIILSEEFLDG